MLLLLLLCSLLLSACGQAGSSYSPTIITSSRISISSDTDSIVENPVEELSSAVTSAVSPIFSETSSANSSAASSHPTSASSKATSSEINSVPSSSSFAESSLATSSKPDSSQQSSTANSAISSVKSSMPAISIGQDLEVTSLTSPIVRGQTASITVKGKPDVEYTIKVIYKSGPSTAKGLEPKISELNGLVTWSWKVSSRTTAGDWSIEVSGDGSSITVPFVVTE